MGFITKQIKNDLIDGTKTPLFKREKTDEELAIESISKDMLHLIKEELKRYQMIDLEHLKKAFDVAFSSLTNEVNEHYLKEGVEDGNVTK
jgi:hypothetical protein